MSGDPRHRGAFKQDIDIQRKRNYEMTGDPDQNASGASNIYNETMRRIEDQLAAVQPQAATPAGVLSPSPFIGQPPPPPIPLPVIDRFHKWSSHYVIVANDHINDDSPLNPGYAPAGQASTINAGYAYARDVLLPKLPSGHRITLMILGGTWTEDLEINSNFIDVIGIGRPHITGLWHMDGRVTKCILQGIWLISRPLPVGTPIFPYALTIDAPNVALGAVDLFVDQAQIEIRDCWLEGFRGAMYAARRILAEDSFFFVSVYGPHDTVIPAQLTEAVRIDVSPNDYRWSIFRRCTLQGRMKFSTLPPFNPTNYYGVLGWQADGRALIASAAMNGSDSNYYQYEQVPFTGVMLEWCTINGQCVADGWRVYHEWCRCLQVSTYGLIKGLPVNEGVVNHVIGQMRFSHCDVYARYVATFDGRYRGSLGECHFLHSIPNQLVDVPATVQAFISQPNGQGNLYVVKSATSSGAWGVTVGSPLEVVIIDSPVNVPLIALTNEYFR